MSEPTITMNGTTLTIGQAMTVRVALGSFLFDLKDGLGDDEHGRAMAMAYRQNIADIFKMIVDD